MKRSLILAAGLVLLAAASSSALARGDAKDATKEGVEDHRGGVRTEALGALGGGCPDPGANPVTGNGDASLATSGIACASGGITTANSYARVFTQSQIGPDYTINCVNFGVTNTGSAVEGTIGVYVDPTGGAPSVSELVLLDSAAVTLTSGEGQLLVASFEPICVQLTGEATLVVVMDYAASTDGFCTFAGGTAAVSPTYIRASACNVNNFVNLAALGFASSHWFVELSGNFGCADSVPGALNGDGIVDGADLGILLGAWGTADPIADLSGDGLVDGADLGLLLGYWT